MTGLGILQRLIYLVLEKNKFDLIIIEKELVTFMPFFVEDLLLRGSKFIVDYDDNINARYQTGWAKLFLSEKVRKLAGLADAITIGNHWYLEIFKHAGPAKIHYLPTVIDSRRYSAATVTKQEKHPLTITWIGSPATVEYLQDIDNVLARLQFQYNFRLTVIGAAIQLKTNAHFVEWHQDTEITQLKQADIGILPLQNTAWEKGKCGLKLIQYMACGLPVVAAYSIANSDIVGQHCGFLAQTEDEWYNYLSQLLQSAGLRHTLGGNGKARVYKHYSYQTWGPVFVNLVKTIGKPLHTIS